MQLVRRLLPEGPFEIVILVPFGRGPARQYEVAAILARAVCDGQRTMIIRTDAPDWDRPELWYCKIRPKTLILGVFNRNRNPGRAPSLSC